MKSCSATSCVNGSPRNDACGLGLGKRGGSAETPKHLCLVRTQREKSSKSFDSCETMHLYAATWKNKKGKEKKKQRRGEREKREGKRES